MSDLPLIDRLREHAHQHHVLAKFSDEQAYWARDLNEAANIIDSLRAEVETWRTTAHDVAGQRDALRAEVERLKRAIDEHNVSCEHLCSERDDEGKCEAWTSRGMKCCDCPRDWMIERATGQQQPSPASDSQEQKP